MANEVLNRRNNERLSNMNDPFFDNLAHRFLNPVADWMDWVTPSVTSTAINGLLTDVKETKNAYEVHVDVPGVDKNNIKINYHDNILSINVHKDDITNHADKDGNIMMSERNYGAMSRSYKLPNIDERHIKATYKNGTLSIIMPKITESKEHGHSIEIQ
ncbi:Hsp20/alpha crystallin family protein [uncultured Lentilactobacillus sp.]|uniref:Hsp20/alpha crystallin family protein n=1 Tax=uncultured Lentilactobacillus sp. TaxID=2805375 RepID=UPI0025956FBA|nr:Hsp20/alpha crystallin family protein [uncultured Lentilactobacillus sp.]